MSEATTRLEEISEQIRTLRQEARTIKRALAKGKVEDYAFQTPSGERKLSDFFGEKDDLLVVHNMGRSCDYCSLWADGLNGLRHHLLDRAGFVLASPDPIAKLAQTARVRGWDFPIASSEGTPFFKDMGFEGEEGDPWPGFSTFHRDRDGTIRHVGFDGFGEEDDYCAVWHLFEFFEGGLAGWAPKETEYC